MHQCLGPRLATFRPRDSCHILRARHFATFCAPFSPRFTCALHVLVVALVLVVSVVAVVAVILIILVVSVISVVSVVAVVAVILAAPFVLRFAFTRHYCYTMRTIWLRQSRRLF